MMRTPPAAESPGEAGPPRSGAWRGDLYRLTLGSLLLGLGYYFLLPAFPLFAAEIPGVRERFVGISVGVFALAAGCARFVTGVLLDRWGRRPWQLAAAAAFGLLMFSYPAAGGLVGLLLIRVLHGLSWGVVFSSSVTVATDLVPSRHRGEGLAFYGLGMSIALMVGPTLGLGILQNGSFTRLFMACGVAGLGALLCFRSVKTPLVQHRGHHFRFRDILEARVFPVAFFLTLLLVGYGGLVSVGPSFASRMQIAGMGPIFAVYGLGNIVSRPLGGRWYDRGGPLGPCYLGLALLLAGWLGLARIHSTAGTLLASFSLGMGIGLIMPCIEAMTVTLVPAERRGAANSLVWSAVDIGISIGAVLSGFIVEAAGEPQVFLAAAGVVAAAGLFFGWYLYPFVQRHRQGLEVGR